MRASVVTMVAVFAIAGASLTAARADDSDPVAGEKVFVAQKCSLCHQVAGKGNKNGPLDGVGKKLTADEIRAWLRTPLEMAKKHNATRKPPMKSFASLPRTDLDALVAYLQTLK